jgi:hypothetical protein
MAKGIADRLRDAAELGDVTELGKIATELKSGDDAALYWAEKIERLAEAFDFDGITELANSLEKG